MRNFTVFALGLAAAMAMPAAAKTASPLKMMKDVKTRLTAGNEGKEMRRMPRKNAGEIMKMSELARKMKPGTTKTFGWDGEEWMPEDVYTYSYDKDGNVLVENSKDAEGFCSRTVNEYNDNGKPVYKENMVSEDGVSFVNNSKNKYEYDAILTDVITNREEWLWMDSEWQQQGNNYHRIITRDEAGNITSCVIAVLFQGIYDPTQKVEVVYGPDGKATEISEQILNFDYDKYEYYWEQGVRITDIVWERTDGQIYDVEGIFTGNNRIGSAHYLDPDGLDMNVTVEYAEDSEAYIATMSMTMDGMSVTATSEYIPLENDGYIGIGTTYFEGEEMYSSREEYRFDEWGLMTFSLESETEEGFSYGESSTGEVEYGDDGMPAVYTVSVTYFDTEFGEEETEYVIRAEYSDYVDVTAGSGVSLTGAEASGKYYDLNGVCVSSPKKGQIVVKNGKTVISR
ncbi:MAG: hypothetical protein K2M16_09075 [Muribaculaceae bacterium]|nr:hypothetical protein [Muribaculaceae bacterium]